MKKRISTIILIIVLLIGLSLLLYPTVSARWNAMHQSRAIANYVEDIQSLDSDRTAEIWNNAVEYNKALAEKDGSIVLSEEERAVYNSNLDAAGNGIMGYIEIPSISCFLPIYHGTQEDILQIAIGHIEGTSLPTGGGSTHCVLSGHRGLPSARLFTDLDKLVPGDIFTMNILDETLTYEVYEILTVLPHEVDELEIEENQDLCTLVTCTPYGINTHRLLVKARRIANIDEESHNVRVVAEAMQIEPIIVASIIAIPMLLVLLLMLLLQPKKRK